MSDPLTGELLQCSAENLGTRRLRNRLSQKAIRERRTAYIEQLEQKVAFFTKRSQENSLDELWEQNAKLRDALHVFRKKLLSVSTTVTSLADGVPSILQDVGE